MAGKNSKTASEAGDLPEQTQTKEAQRESEKRYRFLADAMPQIVWTARPDGRPDYYNRRWHEYTGLTLAQTRGWGPAIHPEDRPRCLERWAQACASGECYESEYRLRRADGAYRWHLGRALPLRDEAGRIVQWVGTATDIDDQKTLAVQADAQARAADDAFARERAARARAEVDGKRARVVAEVALALARTVSLEAVLEAATEALASAFADGGSAVWLHEPASRELRLAAARGYTAVGRQALVAQDEGGETVSAEAFRRRAVVVYHRDDPAMPRITRRLIFESRRAPATVAATPLLVAGRTLGVLSLVARGQDLDESWTDTLQAVGTQVAAAVERARLYEREREIADRLQGALLPALEDAALLAATGLAVAHRYLPGTEGMTVGGDFYDVWALPKANAADEAPQRLAVVLGDVSGKGLEAAVQTAALRHAVLAYAHEDPTPARVIARMSDLVLGLDLLPSGFATMFYAIIDAETGQVDYCSAGHESMLVRSRATGTVTHLESSAPALGLIADHNVVYGGQAVIEPGGEMILYTDGITEARDPATRSPLGLEGLTALLREVLAAPGGSGSAAAMAGALLARVEAYAGGSLEDDAALLVIARPVSAPLSAALASPSRPERDECG